MRAYRGFAGRVIGVWMLLALGSMSGGCGMSMLSPAQEVRIGEQSAPQFIEQAGGEVPDEGVRRYVSTLGEKVVDQIDSEERRELPWEFFVLDSPTINAFALPGGKVFITRGLMERLDNEAQLVGVLGHEVGHVVAEHIGQRMTQQLGLNVGLGIVGAVAESDWVRTLGGVGGQLYLLKFGRGQELESDDYGLKYMVDLGYDPRAMIQVQEVLQEAAAGGAPPEFLSTHPHPESRIEQAQEQIADRYADTRNNPRYVLNREEYQRRALQPLRQLPPADPPQEGQVEG